MKIANHISRKEYKQVITGTKNGAGTQTLHFTANF
jgi:hypothetical protein